MSVENALTASTLPAAPGPETPAAIRVVDLHKAFRIPTQRVDSLKERAVHPFATRDHRELRALDGVSFEVRQGEFFGIVGRNGSGKSTLLKLLASIYRADAGKIQIAGRMAPFIELGVGFNHDLTARENVVLNGVMMGLTPKEMRSRLDSVIDFAELREFADLKLKNYSSGMLVRLAFSVMMEAEADVLLIDEVLAVGDASFQQKCADAFHQMKSEGKTIVLVTHEMAAVEAYCHRAMLLAEGSIQHIGEPAEIGREYLKLNFAADAEQIAEEPPQLADDHANEADGVRIASCETLDEAGERTTSFELGQPIQIRVRLELLRKVPALHVGIVILNADGIALFEVSVPFGTPDGSDYEQDSLVVTAKVENRLGTGRHFLHCAVNSAFGVSAYEPEAGTFVVFGSQAGSGMIAPVYEFEVESGEQR
jgi:ABC-2 type transport system ATP-binding protein